jgi:hypothetical protein
MKKSILALSLLFLAGCSNGTSVSLSDQMRNPLFAERYWSELTDRMVTIQLNNPELSKDEDKYALVDGTRQDALAKAQAATAKRKLGMIGNFISMNESVDGLVLLMEDALHIGPGFASYPGPSLHLYITTIVDPREGKFPDETSIDLGVLQSPYDTQSYPLPTLEKSLDQYRTAVLWDTELERLYAFAQLAK